MPALQKTRPSQTATARRMGTPFPRGCKRGGFCTRREILRLAARSSPGRAKRSLRMTASNKGEIKNEERFLGRGARLERHPQSKGNTRTLLRSEACGTHLDEREAYENWWCSRAGGASENPGLKQRENDGKEGRNQKRRERGNAPRKRHRARGAATIIRSGGRRPDRGGRLWRRDRCRRTSLR